VRPLLTVLLAGFFALSAGSARAVNTEARLLLAADVARPGETVMAGVHLRMAEGWHTYWRNSGASGLPTTIKWELPPGVSAGEIQWPVPEKLTEEELTTYVYHDDVVLLIPLQLADDLPHGTLELKAAVSWLECKVQCLPGDADVSATLRIGAETKPSGHAPLLQTWIEKLPKPAEGLSPRANWEKTAAGNSRPLLIEWNGDAAAGEADFYPYANEGFELEPKTERVSADAGQIRIRKPVTKFDGDWPMEISGLLIQHSGTETLAHEATMPIGRATGAVGVSLWKMLLFAFIGGFILNFMPCVFPVIALKILGFVQQSKEAPRRVFKLGLIYGLGVLVSFLTLAGIVIAVQQAGGAASWGMQLQNPYFSLALTLLIVLVALNLFGVFEINLGGRAMGAAGELTARHGPGGAFFNGVLATVLATPCTAPFLAPALGFAFAQPPALIAVFFATVALGLAAPYIVLSWRPAWLRFLPRPGPWMEKFKILLGFPMLAVAIWLFSFTARRFGPDGPLWVGLFLLIVALAAWIWGEFVQRGRQWRGLAMAVSLILVVAGYTYGMETRLNWRAPVGSAPAIAWQKWSPEAVEQARQQGRPVLVDFTADWCLTCQFNKRSSIEIPAVRTKLNEINALALVGDNTDSDPNIVAELRKFDRAGVPLVLVYPRDSQKPPVVLPELLTPSMVLDALNQAAQ
jgi:thiol:disulfide interchange protein